ncbi:MAG: efflux transporter outer membrane subunit [Pelagimonas sp.]|uniref:efflux transporter outer membrane subunit n=1 Tax=Pelagimonas sp. TaxID=2073170 RepID=UPI003D6BF095
MWTRGKTLLSLLATAGCAPVGADFRTPDADLGARFLSGGTTDNGDVSADKWWTDLRDGRLSTFIDRGLSANLDVRTALSRIEQAEAGVRQTGLNAQLDGSLSASLTRSGGEGLPTTEDRSSALSGSVVIDLFGGIRRGREQALAELEAAGFSVGDARLAFLSSIVGNYISARFNQQAAELTRRSIKTREETLDLVKFQVNEGAASQLDLARADADLQATTAELPNFIAGFNAAVFAIATLIDVRAQSIFADMQRGAPLPWPGRTPSTGTPANLLRNIPSIRTAERSFAAAVASAGVAEAELYPSLTLSGNVSVGDTESWSFGPLLSFPVLSHGLRRATRDQAIAAAKEAELLWRSAVLTAVESVEAASSNLAQSRRRVQLLRGSVAAQETTLNLSRSVFTDGDLDLIDLLETERSTLDSQVQLAQAVQDVAISWVELQIATGRG